MVHAYCTKEKKKNVDIVNPVYSVTSNGRNIVKGKCSSCGGKVAAFVSGDAAAGKKKGGKSRSRKTRSRKTKSRASRKSRKSRKSRRSHK